MSKRLQRQDAFQKTVGKVQAEFHRWVENEDWLHVREMARFFVYVVDQPELARRLSLINISKQREPEDMRLEQHTRHAQEQEQEQNRLVAVVQG